MNHCDASGGFQDTAKGALKSKQCDKVVSSPASAKNKLDSVPSVNFEQIFESLKICPTESGDSLHTSNAENGLTGVQGKTDEGTESSRDDSGLGPELRSLVHSMDQRTREKAGEDEVHRWQNIARKLDLAPGADDWKNNGSVHLNPKIDDNRSPTRFNHQQSKRANSTHNACRYSRKVFVGGLPSDASERDISISFAKFGLHTVDWPYRRIDGSCYPPKGYCFLLFNSEVSVRKLMECCVKDDDRFYWHFTSSTVVNKVVQVRPWMIIDSEYIDIDFLNSCSNDRATGNNSRSEKRHRIYVDIDSNKSQLMAKKLHPRNMIFVGGIPRPTKAKTLAAALMKFFGPVLYAAIDTDSEFNYPKGAGKVLFKDKESYYQAIKERFIKIVIGDHEKRIELKPFILENQPCDICHIFPQAISRYDQNANKHLNGDNKYSNKKFNADLEPMSNFAKYLNTPLTIEGLENPQKILTAFCPSIDCLKYYCQKCWFSEHEKNHTYNSPGHCPTVRDIYSGTFVGDMVPSSSLFQADKVAEWSMHANETTLYPGSGAAQYTNLNSYVAECEQLYTDQIDMKLMEKFDLNHM